MSGNAESRPLRERLRSSLMREDEMMFDDGTLQRVTLFLEKSKNARPWRLSIRTLDGRGVLDRYYGRSDRPLLGSEVELMVTDVTMFLRGFLVIDGIQQTLQESDQE